MFGNENHHTELRFRTALEVINNENTNSSHLKAMSSEHAANKTNLFEYVTQTSVADSSLSHRGTSMVESERAELRISAKDGEYCRQLHLYALANLLNRAIVSIYLIVVNVRVDRGLLNQVLLPFHCVNPTTEPVHIIWTNLSVKQVGYICQSNQFAACVPRFPQSHPPCTLPASPEKQPFTLPASPEKQPFILPASPEKQPSTTPASLEKQPFTLPASPEKQPFTLPA